MGKTVPPLGDLGTGDATFDLLRKFRYRLWRDWSKTPNRVLWIMLNPSTADEEKNDRTIGRCTRFAKRWGFGGIEVVNLFALVSKEPADLVTAPDPVGPLNDEIIAWSLRDASLAIVAWGAHPIARARSADICRLAAKLERPLFCLGTTQAGHPRHPLYLPASTRRQIFTGLPITKGRA